MMPSSYRYLPFNAGAVVRAPALEQKLAERILTERQVFAMLDAVAEQPRDHALKTPSGNWKTSSWTERSATKRRAKTRSVRSKKRA